MVLSGTRLFASTLYLYCAKHFVFSCALPISLQSYACCLGLLLLLLLLLSSASMSSSSSFSFFLWFFLSFCLSFFRSFFFFSSSSSFSSASSFFLFLLFAGLPVAGQPVRPLQIVPVRRPGGRSIQNRGGAHGAHQDSLPSRLYQDVRPASSYDSRCES